MDNQHRILQYLAKHVAAAPTMHQLAKDVHMPYATLYRTLKAMNSLLYIAVVGRAKTVRLNLHQDILSSHLAVAAWEERNAVLEHQPLFRKLVETLHPDDIVLLFGSYAKGTATARSDIDLLIINNTGRTPPSFSTYELLYKKTVNPIAVTTKEFIAMLKSPEENVGSQALKDHVVLQHPQRLWDVVLHAIRP